MANVAQKRRKKQRSNVIPFPQVHIRPDPYISLVNGSDEWYYLDTDDDGVNIRDRRTKEIVYVVRRAS